MDVIIAKNYFFLLCEVHLRRVLATITSLVLLIFFFTPHAQAQIIPLSQDVRDRAQAKLESMSLEEKVGQLFVFGFQGTQMDRNLKRQIEKIQPGGLIVFKRNIHSPRQAYLLNKEIQTTAMKKQKIPILLMVDQEGGTVTRIKINPSPPSALALGMTQDTKLVRDVGHLTGKLLALIGFNMNLAPVLDLSDPYQNSFISNRSFGHDPEKVKLYGEAYSSGLMDSGVVPTAKHFPGHGGVITDSHQSLPSKLDTMEQLERGSLIPFQWFSNFQYPSAIMVAHIAFPNIDPSGVPATFSKTLLDGLLRTKLKYPGLIITDDIEMGAAGGIGSVSERAVRAVEAGCDLIMVAWTPHQQIKAHQGVLEAVKTGRISVERLDQSVSRILAVKFSMRPRTEPSTATEFSVTLNSLVSDLRSITNRVTQENFNKSTRGYSYLQGAGGSTDQALIFSADSKFYYSFREHWGRGASLRFMRPGNNPQIKSLLAKSPNALAVFYASGNGTVRILNNLDSQSRARMVVINTTHPGSIFNTGDYLAVININARNYNSGVWIAEFLKSSGPAPEQLREPSSDQQQEEARAPLRTNKRSLHN